MWGWFSGTTSDRMIEHSSFDRHHYSLDTFEGEGMRRRRHWWKMAMCLELYWGPFQHSFLSPTTVLEVKLHRIGFAILEPNNCQELLKLVLLVCKYAQARDTIKCWMLCMIPLKRQPGECRVASHWQRGIYLRIRYPVTCTNISVDVCLEKRFRPRHSLT